MTLVTTLKHENGTTNKLTEDNSTVLFQTAQNPVRFCVDQNESQSKCCLKEY